MGVEYMHLADRQQRSWFQERLEHGYTKPSREEHLRILGRLNAAEAFEAFLQTKYVGQKRFSLEGGESLIPLMDAILSSAARAGIHEVCVGMAHRGRLNVLANLAGKVVLPDLQRVRRHGAPRLRSGFGRRQVPPGHRGRLHRRQRRDDQGLPGREPVAPRGRQPGPARHRPRQARRLGRRPDDGRLPRLADPDPRRRGVRGPGHRPRDAQHGPAARLQDRRHRPRHHQQPGGIHDRACKTAARRATARTSPRDTRSRSST